MKQNNTYELLQGQIIALAYALNLCVKHHPEADAALQDIAQTLEQLSGSMLERGSTQLADGVERIKMALINAPHAPN